MRIPMSDNERGYIIRSLYPNYHGVHTHSFLAFYQIIDVMKSHYAAQGFRESTYGEFKELYKDEFKIK